jgi:hypothetical protein
MALLVINSRTFGVVGQRQIRGAKIDQGGMLVLHKQLARNLRSGTPMSSGVLLVSGQIAIQRKRFNTQKIIRHQRQCWVWAVIARSPAWG